jgi:hypothetical protein
MAVPGTAEWKPLEMRLKRGLARRQAWMMIVLGGLSVFLGPAYAVIAVPVCLAGVVWLWHIEKEARREKPGGIGDDVDPGPAAGRLHATSSNFPCSFPQPSKPDLVSRLNRSQRSRPGVRSSTIV